MINVDCINCPYGLYFKQPKNKIIKDKLGDHEEERPRRHMRPQVKY